jgi:excisionase family DNA binding protein
LGKSGGHLPQSSGHLETARQFEAQEKSAVSRTKKNQLVTAANEALAGIEELPRKRDIAKRYGVSLRTVDRWVNERLIPYIDFGYRTKRFRWSDVEKAVDKLTVREVK